MIYLRRPNAITFDLILEIRNVQNKFVGYSFDNKLGYKYHPDIIKKRMEKIDNSRYITLF